MCETSYTMCIYNPRDLVCLRALFDQFPTDAKHYHHHSSIGRGVVIYALPSQLVNHVPRAFHFVLFEFVVGTETFVWGICDMVQL